MQNYTIAETYTLPSRGMVYNRQINPEIALRSMTTEEEMRRVASVEHAYKNMSDIIDNCMLEDPGISSYDMCIGDYQFLLHRLRVVTYGPEYDVVNTCMYCGCENQDTINLDDLGVNEYTPEYETYREFVLPKSGSTIRLRPQTPRMLDNVNARVKEARKKFKGDNFTDPTLIYLLMELIETIDGELPNPGEIELWLRQLPMADTNTIIQHADKMNDSIGVDIELQCDCDICGLSFKTALRTTSEFFRPAVKF